EDHVRRFGEDAAGAFHAPRLAAPYEATGFGGENAADPIGRSGLGGAQLARRDPARRPQPESRPTHRAAGDARGFRGVDAARELRRERVRGGGVLEAPHLSRVARQAQNAALLPRQRERRKAAERVAERRAGEPRERSVLEMQRRPEQADRVARRLARDLRMALDERDLPAA